MRAEQEQEHELEVLLAGAVIGELLLLDTPAGTFEPDGSTESGSPIP